MLSSITRRSACGLLLGATSGLVCASLPLRPALALDRYFDVRPGGDFKPVTIAVTQFAGDPDGRAAHLHHHQ